MEKGRLEIKLVFFHEHSWRESKAQWGMLENNELGIVRLSNNDKKYNNARHWS